MRFFLGTAQLSRTYGVLAKSSDVSPDPPAGVVHEAEILGLSGLDTSPVYGEAEMDIGRAGTSLPVYTKLHPSRRIDDSITQSRQALRRNFLDGVYLHEEYVASQAQIELLKRLRDRKTEDVGDVGVSIYSVDEFQRANDNPDIDVLQLPYNILDQRFSAEFLSSNLDPAKRVFARSVFLQGVLLRSASQLPPPVNHLRGYKASLEHAMRGSGLDDLDVALGYAMGNQVLAGIIVGASSSGELREISIRKSSLMDKNLSSILDFDNVPTWDAVDPRKWS